MLKRNSGHRSFSLSIMILLMVLVLLINVPDTGSQGTVEIALGDLKGETKIDLDKDGIYESLIIGIELIVYKGGKYGLHGSIGQGISANVGPVDLGVGPHTLELSFSGGPLSVSSLSGHLLVDVEAYSTDPGSDTVKRSYNTDGDYSPEMFESPDEVSSTTVSISGKEVLMKGKKMEVRVNMTSPMISFSYPESLRDDTLSSITYLEVIAFNDVDSDGKWDPNKDDLRYSTDLSDVDWEISTDFSRGFDIKLYGLLQLRLAGTPTTAAFAKMTFSLSSDHLEIDPPSQKFDIDLDLYQPLDADRIAVRQELVDETGKLSIIEGTSIDEDDHSLIVMKGDDRPYGTYSWTDDIEVGGVELSNSSVASSWYEIDGGKASVWFSYPLKGNIQLIHHDPTLSMDPDLPPISSEDDFLSDRPVLMLGGIALGILVVGGTIFWRRMGRSRDPGRGGD